MTDLLLPSLSTERGVHNVSYEDNTSDLLDQLTDLEVTPPG